MGLIIKRFFGLKYKTLFRFEGQDITWTKDQAMVHINAVIEGFGSLGNINKVCTWVSQKNLMELFLISNACFIKGIEFLPLNIEKP